MKHIYKVTNPALDYLNNSNRNSERISSYFLFFVGLVGLSYIFAFPTFSNHTSSVDPVISNKTWFNSTSLNEESTAIRTIVKSKTPANISL